MKWPGVPHCHKTVSGLNCRGLAFLIHNYDFTACKFQCLAHSRPSNVCWINVLRMNCWNCGKLPLPYNLLNQWFSKGGWSLDLLPQGPLGAC